MKNHGLDNNLNDARASLLLPANRQPERLALAYEGSVWTAPRMGRRPMLFRMPLGGGAGAVRFRRSFFCGPVHRAICS